jgi:uncharacterized protein (TIGR03083 family)
LSRDAVLEALGAEADCLVAAMIALSEDDFDQPTSCEPWSVRELLAHVLVACQRLPGMLADPEPPRAEVSAYEYFANDQFGATADADRVEAARQDAVRFPRGRHLVEAIETAVCDMVSLARAAPPDRIVRTRWGDDMLLTEYLKTRVAELAVHGLDLARALAVAPWISAPGAAVTEAVFAESVHAIDLSSLGWDSLTFIAKTTGRAPLTKEEAMHPIHKQLLWPRTT